MKILLAQATVYYPSYGGANKSNRLLLEALAAKGHECCALTQTMLWPGSRQEFQRALTERGVNLSGNVPGADVFRLNGVTVQTVWVTPSLRHLWKFIHDMNPDWVLVSSEDPSQTLLSGALKQCSDRVIYLAHTVPALPFGPDSSQVDASKTELLRRASGIVTVSQYFREYLRRWGGLDSTVLPILLHGSGPFPNYANFDAGFVTMVNPCAYKGISIFIDLARHLPDVQFAAVASWGTNQEDLHALRSCPNIRILEPVEDIDDVLSRTRILLAPSLWAEGLPRIVVEAMLRGIPAMASNVGGLPEAKLGVDYVLPVRGIERYHAAADGGLPKAVVPEQDIGPWLPPLGRLLSDRRHYEELSAASRAAALAYARSITIETFEDYLSSILRPTR
jgi:glycosyltransferase involved in cell wall biosynthesis